MLKVKSFSISDDKGINELLSQYRLASGAHILVSNGEVCVPYEDGEPENTSQRIVDIREKQTSMVRQLDIIVHSQKVLEFLRKSAKERLDEAEANLKEADAYKARKDHEKKVDEARNAVDQLDNQYLTNDHEILRLKLNIEMYDKQVADLQTQ